MPARVDPTAGERRHGLAYAGAAYLLWGAFPLVWPLMEPAGAIEILAHRMVWSLAVVLVLLAITGGFSGVRAVLHQPRRVLLLLCAAATVTVNWGTYIWGVNSGHVVETSLGYFINPLFTIVLGVAVLGERLRRVQWLAVGVGAVAVAVIAIDYGRPPWIALTLAVSFGLYGYFKKRAEVGAVDSLAIETGAMFLPALAALTVIELRGDLVFGHHSIATTSLLASTGLITAIPLLLFTASTRRLPLSVVGLAQYLAPVLQFAVGVGIRHEPLPTAELVGFALVWVALVILSVDGVRAGRRASALARSAEAAAAS